MQEGPELAAIDVGQQLFKLTMERARQLLVEQRFPATAHSNPFFNSPQDERRAHALAVVQACTELSAKLDSMADDAAERARRSQASYAEIGAARRITRQAARQALLRREQKDQAIQQARRARRDAERDDVRWHDNRQLLREEQEERWPPRAWRFRAPTGYRTVTLVEGPADTRTFRVPVGDDAFPFIDRIDVFGRQHERYARYTAVTPGADQYGFTGEYFVRWS